MEERIAKGLETLFERHRVVFWYDTKQELRGTFDALQLPNVEKVELANNEFGVKHRILREVPARADDQLNTKDGMLDPIRSFIEGPQHGVFDESHTLLWQETGTLVQNLSQQIERWPELRCMRARLIDEILAGRRITV